MSGHLNFRHNGDKAAGSIGYDFLDFFLGIEAAMGFTVELIPGLQPSVIQFVGIQFGGVWDTS